MINKLGENRVALVTGASSGIGKSVVLQLLKMGFRVHAAARRTELMTEIANEGAVIHRVDLLEPGAISSLIEEVFRQESRVDILINNAGYGSYGSVEEVSMQEARDQMEVNLFAPALLIQEVLPIMRAQRSGKIINVSSIGAKLWSPLGAWYHSSKFALEGLSDSLRNEVRPFGIDVILIEPGAIRTEWASVAIKKMKQASAEGPYAAIGKRFAEIATGPQAEKLAADPQCIADIIAKAIEAKHPRARYVAPFSGKVILVVRWILSDRMFDAGMGLLFRIPKTLR